MVKNIEEFKKVLKDLPQDSFFKVREDFVEQWHFDKNVIDPTTLSKKFYKKVFWKCSKCDSDYEKVPREMIDIEVNCPYCNMRKINHTNNIFVTNPELKSEWNHEKNQKENIFPENIGLSFGKKVWWTCKDCNSDYNSIARSKAHSISKGNSGCPYCKGFKVNHTNNIFVCEDTAKEWSYILNKDKKPEEVHKGSHKKVWWNCGKCNSDFETSPMNRNLLKTNCPYCAGVKVNETNSIESLFPDLAKEWHPTKNKKLKPSMVTRGSDKKAWWLCEKGHEWQTLVKDRAIIERNNNCPVCSNRKIVSGTNDLFTTHPDLAKKLANPEDAHRISRGSAKKVRFRCDKCETDIGLKSIKNIYVDGLSCVICSSTVEVTEGLFATMLRELGVKFNHNQSISWSDRKQYDFHLPEYNAIIELHGLHHYEEVTMFHKTRTLEEEKWNDIYKRKLALENGIETYIEIPTIDSRLDILAKDFSTNEELRKLLPIDNLDWGKIIEDFLGFRRANL